MDTIVSQYMTWLRVLVKCFFPHLTQDKCKDIFVSDIFCASKCLTVSSSLIFAQNHMIVLFMEVNRYTRALYFLTLHQIRRKQCIPHSYPMFHVLPPICQYITRDYLALRLRNENVIFEIIVYVSFHF